MSRFFVFVLVLITTSSFGQKFEFTQEWTWKYSNDWLKEEGGIGQGQMTAYYNPTTKLWLFTPESYGTSGGKVDFVIGNPDGTYVLAIIDPEGKKRQVEQSVYEYKISLKESDLIDQQFEENYTATSNELKLSFSNGTVLEGKGYKLKNSGEETTIRTIAQVPTDFSTVVYFNFLNGGIQLPYLFSNDIPHQATLLEEKMSVASGKTISITLQEVKNSKKEVNLKKYKK